MEVTSFRAVWLVPERGFEDAAPLLGEVDALLERYLAAPNLSCCSIQAGFFVDVDGEPWSNDGTVDEPYMTTTWFHALRDLLGGAARTGPGHGPWEQSLLTFERHGASLVMVDGPATKDGRPPAMRRVVLDFVSFFSSVIEGGLVFRALSAELRAACERRRAAADAELRARLDVVTGNVFLEGDLDDLEDLAARLAPP